MCIVEEQTFMRNHLDKDIVRSIIDLFKKDVPTVAFQFYELALQLEYYPRQQVKIFRGLARLFKWGGTVFAVYGPGASFTNFT